LFPWQLLRVARPFGPMRGRRVRCWLDIGKAELVCCVRVPAAEGKTRRVQEVTTYQTMTKALLGMVDRLTELGVTRVVMEATSDYWKPPFYL
jgi:transposase